jgi:hypothetical protein
MNASPYRGEVFIPLDPIIHASEQVSIALAIIETTTAVLRRATPLFSQNATMIDACAVAINIAVFAIQIGALVQIAKRATVKASPVAPPRPNPRSHTTALMSARRAF